MPSGETASYPGQFSRHHRLIFVLLLGIYGVIYATLRGIFVAALYTYAKTGTVPGAFSEGLIAGAFMPKNLPGRFGPGGNI